MNALLQLRQLLLAPERAGVCTLPDWDAILRLADVSSLTGSLAAQVQAAGVLPTLPAAVQARLSAATVQYEANLRAATWEVTRLERALMPLGVRFILLKGAAYALAGLPAGQGRLFGDIDILVDRASLATVETGLFWHGWINTHHDAYDDRYYRQWMHELPPLIHQKRQTVLDIHHTILPPTARYHPDPAKLRADAIPIPGCESACMLAPVDMVIHSACHLFHESEWDKGLRDLFDLDRLLRHFGQDGRFGAELTRRAYELELQRPLYYALRYCQQIWQTPLAEEALPALRQAAPPEPVRWLMDKLILQALAPRHRLLRQPGRQLACLALYIRGHWLRMPLHLLLPHLLRKSLRPLWPQTAPAGR